MASKVVFVTGGVCSSLGKGIVSAALGRLLRRRGLNVRVCKLDPYLNVDPGTMNPSEHGEVFVTFDGGETDLDLGHYERFLGVELPASCSISSGQVYSQVLAAERRGEHLGRTVQMVPHVVDEIRRRIDVAGEGTDVLVCEIGGTVGDMEIDVFLEAVRRFREDHDCVHLHLVLVPEVGPNRELKTKPAQHAVTLLRSYGLVPDLLVVRSHTPVGDPQRQKLHRLCGVPLERVVAVPDLPSVYLVPRVLEDTGVASQVCGLLGVDDVLTDDGFDVAVTNLVSPPAEKVRVAVVGKYLDGADTYLSVVESVKHAAAAVDRSVELVWVDAEDPGPMGEVLDTVDAVVVPGGFGSRGVSGKLFAAELSRTRNIPFLGLCLGLQVLVVEFARHVAGIEDATHAEWGVPGSQVITLLDSQQSVVELGGTMRLGAQPARLVEGTVTAGCYQTLEVTERHRHRFEVNPVFVPTLEAAGLVVSGVNPVNGLVEFVEVQGHRFMVATQAHPELTSRPDRPHPLFVGLLQAAVTRS